MVKLVGTSWTQITGGAGFNTIFTSEKMTYYVSRSADGSNPIAIRPDMLIGYDGAVPIYIKGATESSYVVVSDAFRSALSRATGGGGGGTSYTFNAPLSESGGNVDLSISSDFSIDGNSGALTLNLSQNQNFKDLQLAVSENSKVASLTQAGRVQPKENDFTIALDGLLALDKSSTGTLGIMQSELESLKLRLNRMAYPQFDFLEINWTPDVFKQGTFSLGEISPTASGNISLRRGTNLHSNFGTLKNSDYNSNDFCYNNIEGFFFIGKNNKLINLYTNGLLNSKLASGKYTIQFTFEVTEFGDTWKQPIYLQVNGTFSTDIGNTDYKDNSNRLEFGNPTAADSRALYAYNWKGGTTESSRVVNLPNLSTNTKISGVAVYDGNTTTIYTRKAGQTSYTKQGTMNATPPDGGNLRVIGFVRGVNTSTCASIKIYELRFWAGVALSESEVQQLVKVSKDLS